MDFEAAILTERDLLRSNLLHYTERAYRCLPVLERPRILDIGCGSGVVTVALARFSGGDVVALDIDLPALARLRARAAKAGLADRIQVLASSALNLEFPPESFELIWSEGSIYVTGFERGLRDWRCHLKPGGYLLVHDMVGDTSSKLALVKTCGYELLQRFGVPKHDYRAAYYAPLERWLRHVPLALREDPEAAPQIELLYQELAYFNAIPGRYASMFYLMRRRD